MATLQFTFETGATTVAEIVDAFAARYGYKAEIPDPDSPTIPAPMIPNPMTKAQFARQTVRGFIIEVVHAERVQTARQTADAGVPAVAFEE